ncbi:MAG TPA: DUF1330 domain-containing protein [Chitinophagaceae bacterium]|nr:DUF1330 domain-containing protein [Chitinophagaceae bacterium]
MPVYVVNAYDIHDFDTFKEYPPRVAPLLLKHGAKLLAMDTAAKALEGEPKAMNAIVEFPSEEAVHNFYNDPEYQSFIDLRHKSTSNCTMIILKEYGKNDRDTQ